MYFLIKHDSVNSSVISINFVLSSCCVKGVSKYLNKNQGPQEIKRWKLHLLNVAWTKLLSTATIESQIFASESVNA